MPQRRLRLRYPARCVKCQSALLSGTDALWDNEAKAASCLECPAPMDAELEPVPMAPTFVSGTAGASARREGERRSAKRADRIRRRFGRFSGLLLKDSGITNPKTVNWHTLRHTAASLWLKAGVDVFVVSRRLGHSNPGFTMRVYSHLLPGQQKAAAEALDHLLAR